MGKLRRLSGEGRDDDALRHVRVRRLVVLPNGVDDARLLAGEPARRDSNACTR